MAVARGGCEAREAELVAAPGLRRAAPQQQHELELRSAMAATALGASVSAREGGEGVGRRVRKAECPFKREQRRWDARWHGAERWGAATLHGGHALDTRPLRRARGG